MQKHYLRVMLMPNMAVPSPLQKRTQETVQELRNITIKTIQYNISLYQNVPIIISTYNIF